MVQSSKTKLGIFGVVVLLIGINMCAALFIYALAGDGGSLILGELLFGTGLLLTFIGMGTLFLHFVLRHARKKADTA